MRVHRMSGGQFGSKALRAALGHGWLLIAALAAAPPAHADVLADVQLLRRSGCGGLEPALAPLHHVEQLDRAAAQWAHGRSLASAAGRAGYTAQQLAGVRLTRLDAAILQDMRRTRCVTLLKPHLTAVGIYARGRDVWLVLASTHLPSHDTRLASTGFAARVLELVNAVRARGASCGARAFGATGPVRLSALLDQVAYGHALDMAEHDYFEHQDLGGRTPADRVRAAGYREKLVGENIAYGPDSPEEVVRGWLDSPGHCENIMDPRFAEMGIAAALGRAPQPASGVGLYWVQLLVDPKS